MATPQTFSQNDANHELNLDEARTVFAVIPDAYDTNERVVKMAMLSWNTVSLSWVKFTGSSGGGGGAITVVGAEASWIDIGGGFIIPPGSWGALAGNVTLTTGVMALGILWAELPY